MSVLNLAAPESRDQVRSNFLAGYDRPYEAIGLKKDGTKLTGELRGRPIMHRGQLARVVAVRDISERKRAEESLAAEKERLAVTLRSIGDGVITTDVNGCIVIMNKVAEELTGWAWCEAQGQPLAVVFKVINEITRQPCENPVARVLSTGGVVELANHTLLITRNGAERIIADSGAPIKDEGGHAIGVVLVFRDITEKQRLANTILRTAKLDSLGVLAGGIAHDFNNLLTGVFGYVDLARVASKDPEIIEYLGAAASAINRARALTLQLLTFAKGGAPIQKVTPLVPFIPEAVRFALSGSNVACQFRLPEGLWTCNIDKDQIGQVIDNIVINALHAMPDGGTIEVTAKNVALDEGDNPSLVRGKYVRMSIKDFGVGIPINILPRIFDPFYTTKPKGHGLGLATCYSIINRHGGCIDAESEPGQGSTFHVYLPAVIASAAADGVRTAEHEGSGTIIVVDDEEVIRVTIRKMLELLGYSVVCKKDGREAIDHFISATNAGHVFAAMIFDLTIPGGMGGLEAIAEIRKLDGKIPVFVASGYADDSVMRNPEEYGFTSSLCKPFTIAELSEMLGGCSKN
jgi:two-component system, cell cycle sensor histidine kinase and response regulator CckA